MSERAIDSLCTIEVTGRGVARDLYLAARAAQGGLEGAPLCLRATQVVVRRVRPGDVVVTATGLPTYPWFSGEQDVPVGAATLSRAPVLGLRPDR